MGPWPLDPRGPQAEASTFVYWVLFACAIPVLAIVCGSLIYSGIKFRERPGHEAKQLHGHNLLEMIWTVVTTVMVIFITGLDGVQIRVLYQDDTGAEVSLTVQDL